MKARWGMALVALAIVGCSSDPAPTPTDAGQDVARDTGTDVSGDTARQDTGTPPSDMGTPPADTGTPPADTGTPPTDTGTPPTDTGTPPADTDTPPADTGTPPADTGTPPADTGTPPMDTGTPPADTGTPPTDTGTPPTDTGAPPTDTGAPPTDVPATCTPTVTVVTTLTLPATGTITRTGTTAGSGSMATQSCVSAADGPEAYYLLNITSRTGVALDTNGSTFDTVLSVLDGCSTTSPSLACDDDSGEYTRSSLRAALNPGRYLVALDGIRSGAGAYTLHASTYTPVANETCATAAPLTPGTPITNIDPTTGSVINRACAPGEAPQLFYALAIPAGQRATITAHRSDRTGTVRLRVMDSCAATTCIANASGSTTDAVASAVNTGATTRTVIVTVASTSTDNPVTVDLSATLGPIPAGVVCESAPTLTPGTPITGIDTFPAATVSAACMPGEGPQRFYRLTVPGGQRATVTAHRTSATGTVRLRALASCAATTCVDEASGSTTDPSIVVYNTGATRDYIASVASTVAGTPVTVDLSASLAPFAANGRCATPTTLTPGATAMGQDLALGAPANIGCTTVYDGPQLFYAVTIPAGRIATVTATPLGAWSPQLHAYPSCATTACIGTTEVSVDGRPVAIRVPNLTTGPITVIVSVARFAATSLGGFSIAASLTSAPFTVLPAACDDLTTVGTSLTPSGGWTDNVATEPMPLPAGFAFFFGGTITQYTVSSNGFAQLWPASVGAVAADELNAQIPNVAPPNSFVAPFWDDLDVSTAAGVRSGVYTAVFGTAPNRRFVIEWRDWAFHVDRAATRLRFQAKLFETTHMIEVHYCRMDGSSTSGADATGGGATVGVENATGTGGWDVGYNAAGVVGTTYAYRFASVL
ncbi:MAG: hypothetical protein U0326_36505 [Polyangiales bacterium]